MLTKLSVYTGETQLTNVHPPPSIPDSCYDCADGFYDPNSRVITSYTGRFLRNAGKTNVWVMKMKYFV